MTRPGIERRGQLTRARETRRLPVQLQVRQSAAGGTTTIEGHASVTETPYEMYDLFGPYSEVIRRGAFTKTLAESPPVQLLLNHGGLSMAYTRAGTLRLSEDLTGLAMSADVNPARGDVRDMLLALEDGAVDEMSFAFTVAKQEWSPDYAQRDIGEVDMHRGDVSVVNFGANPSTDVAARAAVRKTLRAELRRMVRAPSSADTATLTALLARVAAADAALDPLCDALCLADDALDLTAATLAGMLGIANPDPADAPGDMPMDGMPATLAAAQLNLLRISA